MFHADGRLSFAVSYIAIGSKTCGDSVVRKQSRRQGRMQQNVQVKNNLIMQNYYVLE